MAIDLEKGGKGSLQEIGSVLRTFSRFRPFTIELEDGTWRRFDSLLFANIAQMAKYATLSDDGRPDDGQFEVISLPHAAKWRVLGVALKAAIRGLGAQPSARQYHFVAVKPIPMQVDGEIVQLDAGTAVTIDIADAAFSDHRLTRAIRSLRDRGWAGAAGNEHRDERLLSAAERAGHARRRPGLRDESRRAR